MHEPTGASQSELEDLVAALAGLKQQGRIRFAGLAGANACGIAARLADGFDVMQTAENGWVEGGLTPDFTYGIASTVGPDWGSKLRQALDRRPQGAVIVGTTSVPHLRQTVDLVTT